MERIEFPDGNWIEVREAAEVPERLRRPYLAACALAQDGDAATRLEAIRRANTLGVVAILNGWSYEKPPSVDALEDLPSLRYDEIIDACSSRVDKLTWSMVVSPETLADPKAPSDGSSSSKPGWPIPTP